MVVRRAVLSVCAVAVAFLGGCRMSAPLHVWQEPKLESTVGKKVALSQISSSPDADSKELGQRITERIVETAPSDPGRATHLVPAESLEQKSKIQLVSTTDQRPNDLALASVARKEGYDFVLRGEIVEDRYAKYRLDSAHRQDSAEEEDEETDKSLAISWRLTSLTENRPAGGSPVSIDVETAVERYPDLGLTTDQDTILAEAISRESLRLIAPWIDREQVQIAIPYLLPGSREVRRGNIAALSGQWQEAERIWQGAYAAHPSQVAALHNLAIAAAARQDFSTAKRLARKAVRLQPTWLNKHTLVWVEVRQRDYHAAFDLPDPPEGWFVTNSKAGS